ncbi:hypothetical protein [Neobacillus paridis]|nr:hypothetical protein [Neobacillus paridis]
MLYANKQFLVSVTKVEADGELHTPEVTLPVYKNNLIATDQNGNQFVLTDSHFLENYIPVEKVETKSKRRLNKSPFELAELEEVYKQNWVGAEEDQYIYGTKKLANNK